MRDTTPLVVTQSALQAMVASMVGTPGLDSLQKIAGNLSAWLEADCVMVGEIQPDNQTVRVLAMQLDGKAVDDFIYTLKGTPCENVREKGFCHYPDDAARLFPESKDLVELNIRGYIGTPLKKSDRSVIGILCALFRRPFPSSPTLQEILEIFAVKAGAEIERSQMERALRQSEDKFRSIVETSPDMIWETDMQGNFRYMSPMVQTIMGYTPEEVIGKSILDLVPEQGRSAAMQKLMHMISTEGELSPVEIPARHRNGSDILLEIRPSRLTGTDGKLKGLRGVTVDITERKRAEEDLRESEEKFRSFVESANEIMFSLTPDGIFTYISPNWTELMGHDTREVIGKNATDFIHPDDLSQNREVFLRTLATGKKTRGTEYRVRHKDGSWRWNSQSISPIRNTEGRVIGIQGISHDITDRKKMEEAIQEANKKLSLLSSITRHDINNQLLALNGFVSLLQHDIPDTSYEKYFSRITDASKNIAEMIEFTKEYEQIGTGVPVWQDLATVITAGKGIIPGQITFKNNLPATTEVFADPMLEKVFFNLLDNAVRHGERVTQIQVSSCPEGEDLVIVWEDNGVGIAADEKERIFERGFGKNTGLGMFLVREILFLTGISIRETGEPGRGVRFEMTVPRGAYRIRS